MTMKIAVAPSLQSHTTLPPLIYLLPKVPLPEDAMEDDSDCLSAMGKGAWFTTPIPKQYPQSVDNAYCIEWRSESKCRGTTCSLANAVVAPLNPLNTTTHRLKLATPSEFTGDCTKGCAFLNSCKPLHWAWPLPSLLMTKQGFTGSSLLWKVIVLCAFTDKNHVDLHSKWDYSHEWTWAEFQTWVHMWLLAQKKRSKWLAWDPGDI